MSREPGISSATDCAALDAAYAQALPRLRRLVAGLGFAPPDADDLLQAAYVQGRRTPPEWRGPAAAERWWQRVTVNACLAEHRRRAWLRRRQQPAETLQQLAGPAGSRGVGELAGPGGLAAADERERVRRALHEMDEDLAAPLVLRYWRQMDATEIGAMLELPAATVRTRLRTARLWLAERLGPMAEQQP